MSLQKPDWLRIRVRGEAERAQVEKLLAKLSLNTVCEEANCPNLCECFGRKVATFMILGNSCTRNCTFCNVSKGTPEAVNPEEPAAVAQAVAELGLKHVVITSVTRDDLPDGGASHFAAVVREIHKLPSGVTVEVLIPDFRGDPEALKTVVEAGPEVINHNVETVPRLYPEVRPMAVYQRSLELIKRVKEMEPRILTKSGIMVGLGETEGEVLEVMRDLKEAGCDFLTVGQYLAPSRRHHPVAEYVHPLVFQKYRDAALETGFKYVASAPLVRSSYRAEEALTVANRDDKI